MAQEKNVEIVEVNTDNVAETGFFCYMSKKQTEGYKRKMEWLKARFAEGMKIKMLKLPERGFIEYIPGEYAWRPVNANGYIFIHCIWIVEKSKGKGYASLLLDECIKDAKKSGKHGVAIVTSEGVWLSGKKFFLKHGFESIAQAPPAFELLVKKFSDAPCPSFVNNWDKKSSQFGNGLTILRSDQCPYISDAVKIISDAAAELEIKTRVIELNNCQEVRDLSPSAFGVFNVVYNGKLFSYHYLTKKDFLKRISELK